MAKTGVARGSIRGPAGVVPGWVSVTAYGAKGDGAADDTAAIQAAIDASPIGGVVWFPAGTYLVSTTIRLAGSRSYRGPGGRAQLAIIKAASGIAGGAVVAAKGWYDSASTCDNPIVVEGLLIDGSSVSGVDGLVIYNFWSTVRDVQVRNIAGAAAGVLATDRGRNGSTTTTNSHSENIFENLRFYDHTSGASAFWAESNNGYSNQDGHLRNSFFSSIAGYGIRLGRAAGWSIVDCHLYGIGYDAISLAGCYATKVQSNYIEDFGAQNQSSPGDPTYGYYNGISATLLNARATIISGNTVSTNQPSSPNGQRFTCYYVVAGSSQTKAKCVFEGNAAVWAASSAPSTSRSRAVDLDAPSGAAMEVAYSGVLIENTTWWQNTRVVSARVTVVESAAVDTGGQVPAALLTNVGGTYPLSEYGLIGASCHPDHAPGSATVEAASRLGLYRVWIPAGAPISGVVMITGGTAGASPGSGTLNRYAVYDDTGALVASTADDTALFTTASSVRARALSSVIAAQPVGRFVYLGFVHQMGTAPTHYRVATLSAALSIWKIVGGSVVQTANRRVQVVTGVTSTLPSSFTPSSTGDFPLPFIAAY